MAGATLAEDATRRPPILDDPFLWLEEVEGKRALEWVKQRNGETLAELQADGRMTNVELARRVGISAPPCLRRVRTLEEQGFIRGYHADIDARELGFEVQVFAMVGLVSQAEADLSAFEDRCRAWPLVRECHMLNGEVDFILKCVAPDLSSFQSFLTGELLTAPNVASVKTSLVIRGAKDEPGVPFDVLEARLSKSA